MSLADNSSFLPNLANLALRNFTDLKKSQEEADNDITTAKAVTMCVLFVASFTLGTIPIKLSKWLHWGKDARNNVYVQLLLCMGGGVLFCTTFIHLVPEVEESIEGQPDLADFPFPLASFLMCSGFFIMYFVEECVHVYLRHKTKNLKVLERSLSIRRGEKENNNNNEEGEMPKIDEHHDHQHHEGHGHSHLIVDETILNSIRGLLVVLALSIHELFEGFAVGLESSASNVWYMFGAVAAHKLVIAFCIGVELISCNVKTVLIVIYVLTFAVVSPMGIGIGIALSENGSDSTAIPSIILQGFASGTLLYVVFFEILQEDRKSGLKNFFAVLVGFLIMLGLSMLEGDEDEE